MSLFVIQTNDNNTKINDMKLTEKQKVIARLVKWGHNEETATRWTNEHYEYVSNNYSGVSKMAEVISILD